MIYSYCRQPLGYVGNVQKTSHELAKGKDYLVLMTKVTGSLKEDLGEKLEVEVAMVEEKVPWGKVVVKNLDLMEERIDNRWVMRDDDKKGTPVEGWRSNMDKH
ncbi:hypothetical protein Tco_1464093 [Tanacetum coccineum]